MAKQLKSDILHIPKHLAEAEERSRREDIAGFSRNLLTWMVSGDGPCELSEQEIKDTVRKSFRLAEEWRNQKDELDKAAEEDERDDTKGGGGVI
jgi:hypothetical protein